MTEDLSSEAFVLGPSVGKIVDHLSRRSKILSKSFIKAVQSGLSEEQNVLYS